MMKSLNFTISMSLALLMTTTTTGAATSFDQAYTKNIDFFNVWLQPTKSAPKPVKSAATKPTPSKLASAKASVPTTPKAAIKVNWTNPMSMLLTSDQWLQVRANPAN